MYWLGFVVLVLVMAFAGFRKAQRAGTWSWSKFFLALGFIATIFAIVSAPLVLMNKAAPSSGRSMALAGSWLWASWSGSSSRRAIGSFPAPTPPSRPNAIRRLRAKSRPISENCTP